jgi:hypothetical protein
MVSLWFLHHKKLLIGRDFGGGAGKLGNQAGL